MPERAELSRSTWADRFATLERARAHDWPLVSVGSRVLHSEVAWRGWVREADRATLLAVRDMLAAGAPLRDQDVVRRAKSEVNRA